MYIRHVVIENVRRFGRETAHVNVTLPSHGWIVIAGRNGAGKTTFLQAIALALSPGFQHDYADTMFTWWREGALGGRTELTLVPSAEDELRTDVTIQSNKPADDEMVIGDHWAPSFGAMSHGREADKNRAFAGPWHPDPKGWFAVGYGSHRRLLGQSSATDGWSSSTTREGAFLTLFRDDAALVHPIRWLMDVHYRSLDPHQRKAEQGEAARIVKGTIELLNDGLLGDIEVLNVNSSGLTVRQDGKELSILKLGAGAQILAALVVDILRHMVARFGSLHIAQLKNRPIIKHDGVVLIDEVDAHLHVSWQKSIGPWFTQHFPNIQFIVTTHSPFICQSAVEDGLVLLPSPGSSEHAKVADKALYNRVVNGSVDEALLSEVFGLEHTWSEQAEKDRARLAELDERLLSGKATKAEKQERAKLLATIPQTMSDEVERAAARVRNL